MTFKDFAPDCRVNLDYGSALNTAQLNDEGVVNIPYREGEVNLIANALGLMVDTVTMIDDGLMPITQKIRNALRIAPLAKQVLILRKYEGRMSIEHAGYTRNAAYGFGYVS